jgi:hypothetical protein
MQGMLTCPRCKTELQVEQVLDNCTESWPNQRWVAFSCPTCKKESHAQLQDGAIALGILDGAPGPSFSPESEMKLPGLKVASSGRGIACRLGERNYNFRAKTIFADRL